MADINRKALGWVVAIFVLALGIFTLLLLVPGDRGEDKAKAACGMYLFTRNEVEAGNMKASTLRFSLGQAREYAAEAADLNPARYERLKRALNGLYDGGQPGQVTVADQACEDVRSG